MVTAVLLLFLALANSFPWTLATAALLLLLLLLLTHSHVWSIQVSLLLRESTRTAGQRLKVEKKEGEGGKAGIGQADGKQRRAASPAFTH